MNELVTIEGLQLEVEPIEVNYGDDFSTTPVNVKPGDTVIGRRNGPWHVGTVSEKLWHLTTSKGYLYCDEPSFYPFYFGECRKVIGGI